MLILGIAEPNPRWTNVQVDDERLLLAPWAVQAALSRRGRRSLTKQTAEAIKRCTRDDETLRWPAGIRP